MVNKPFRNISREAFGGEVSLQALEHYYADLMRQTGAGYLRSAYDAVRLLRRQMEFVKNTDLKLAVWFLRKACGYENYLQQRQDGTDGRMDGDFRFYHGGSRAV